MLVPPLHDWQMAPRAAIALQQQLADQVREIPLPAVRLVAGVDVSFSRGDTRGYAGVVVMRLPDLQIVEQHCQDAPLTFPYIPGLLSFRELPLVLQVLRRVKQLPDAIICDGQGRAHPRRFGLACHLGVWLDIPTIGCAKSILCGAHAPVAATAGSTVQLVDQEEVIGCVLRTRTRVKPVYVSVGQRVTLPDAVRLALSCCTRYRLPEPIRAAHALVNTTRRDSASESASR